MERESERERSIDKVHAGTHTHTHTHADCVMYTYACLVLNEVYSPIHLIFKCPYMDPKMKPWWGVRI